MMMPEEKKLVHPKRYLIKLIPKGKTKYNNASVNDTRANDSLLMRSIASFSTGYKRRKST